MWGIISISSKIKSIPLVLELENQIDFGTNLIIQENLLHFQQNGAPPHSFLQVRQLLKNLFPNKWNGRREVIEWAPRSPDLNAIIISFGVIFIKRSKKLIRIW